MNGENDEFQSPLTNILLPINGTSDPHRGVTAVQTGGKSSGDMCIAFTNKTEKVLLIKNNEPGLFSLYQHVNC